MNKKIIFSILGALLIILLFVGKTMFRSLRKDRASGVRTTERVEPTARIEGLDDHSLASGSTKTFRIALQGVSCNDLRVSTTGLSLKHLGGSDCSYEISGSAAGNGFIRVFGAGKVLVDSFPVKVTER